jgi:hypothetical protein
MNRALVVRPRDEAEIKFLSDLVGKLGMSSRVIENEIIEDLGLAELMKNVDRSKKTSRYIIVKKLHS